MVKVQEPTYDKDLHIDKSKDYSIDELNDIALHWKNAKPVRGALAAGMLESNRISNEANKTSNNVSQRLDDEVNHVSTDSESIDFRHSDMLGKTFETARLRGDFVDQSLEQQGVNINWYGALADGKTDDTQALTDGIGEFSKLNKKRLLFSGDYRLTSQGADEKGRSYAIKIDGLSDTIIDLTNARFFVDLVDNLPNLFAFYNCSNITIIGGYAEGVNEQRTKNTDLYTGAFIYVQDSTNVVVNNTRTKNMVYNTAVFTSKLGEVYGTEFTYDVGDWIPASAILIFGSSDFRIHENRIDGGLRDGDLSIFGSGSDRNQVYNNQLIAKRWIQGITVDSGPHQTRVAGNYLEGYYYGIDVKADAVDTVVENNTIVRCLVGIADRQGEATNIIHSLNTSIQNNSIIFGGVDETDLGIYGFVQIGIFSGSRYYANILGNTISMTKDYPANYPVCGIMALQLSDASSNYVRTYTVAQNDIQFEVGHGSDYRIAAEGSVALNLGSLKYGRVMENTVSAGPNAKHLVLRGSNNRVDCLNNLFRKGIAPAISFFDEKTTVGTILLQGNQSSVSIVARDTLPRFLTYQDDFKQMWTSLCAVSTTPVKVLSFNNQYTGNTGLVTIDTAASSGGIRYAHSTYSLQVTNDTTAKLVPVSENNVGMAFSIVSTASNKFEIRCSATAGVDAGQTVNLTITNLSPNITVNAG